MNKLERLILIGMSLLALRCNSNKDSRLKQYKNWNYVKIGEVSIEEYNNALKGYDFNNDGRYDMVGIGIYGDINLYFQKEKIEEGDIFPGWEYKGTIGKIQSNNPTIHGIEAHIKLNEGNPNLIILEESNKVYLYQNKK